MAIKITRGKVARPTKSIFYGPEGVGKTTLASLAPDTAFIDAEGGTEQLDVARVEVATMAEIDAAIKELRRSQFGTIALDTIDWIERMLANALLEENNKTSIEDFGFGKGYKMLGERMLTFLGSLDSLLRAGKNVILLAHSKIARFEPPDQAGAYDRYELKMSKDTAPLVKEWADNIIFINYKTKVIEAKDKHTRGSGGTERLAYTSRCATHDAKNRFDLPETVKIERGVLPAELAPIFAGTGNTKPEPVKPEPAESSGSKPQDEVAALVESWGNREAALKFLLSKGELEDGATDFASLTNAYAMRILKNADAFKAAIDEHAKA